MENRILEFKNQVEEDVKNRLENKTSIDNKDWLKIQFNRKNTFLFYLSSVEDNVEIWPVNQHKLIQLDKEDLEYFKRKYLPKLKDEYQSEIDKIKERYGE